MFAASHLLLSVIALAQLPSHASDEIRSLQLDDLISRLPAVGCEGHFDEEHATFVLDPAAEELRRRLGDGLSMSDAQWERALLVSQVIRYRSRWPAELPFSVSMHDPGWAYPTKVLAVSTDPSWKPAQAGALVHSDCGTYEGWLQQNSEYQELGRLTPGSHRIEFEVTVERGETFEERSFRETRDPRFRPAKTNPPPGILWHGRVSIEVEFVDSIDAAIPPAHSKEFGEAVRRSLLVVEPDGYGAKDRKDDLLIAFESWGNAFPELASTAVSMDVELWREGKLLARTEGVVSRVGGFRPCGPADLICYSANFSFQHVLDPEAAAAVRYAGLELRMQGVSRDVLHHWGARTWWDGSLSIPVTALPIEH